METSSNATESNAQKMKKVIKAINKYLQVGTDETSIVICRYLQALSVTIDLSIFDPHTCIATEFYVSLYELLKRLEPRSRITWYCVDVLSHACRNATARLTLINTYQFVPILSRILSDQLTQEKKICLLRLLQELSCGIKISWLIPHLPHLLGNLVKWVESKNEEVVTLSLGVLVNMCYKNLPAIYTLYKNVDIKQFMRKCMQLQGAIVEIYICKLLIILDYTNTVIPPSTLYKLADATFKSVVQAFKSQDAILLRQIVEFFLDVMRQEREAKVLQEYTRYGSQMAFLLEALENNEPMEHSGGDHATQDPECVSAIFDFVHALVETKHNHIVPHYPKIVHLALSWVQTDAVSLSALNVLKSLAQNAENENRQQVVESLVAGFPQFLLLLNVLKKDETLPQGTDQCRMLGAVLLLLRVMVQAEPARQRIIEELQPDSIRLVVAPLLEIDSLCNADISSCDTVNLYVYALALINELARYDSKWMSIKTTLMENKEMHFVLAKALYSSPPLVKSLVLEMGGTTGNRVGCFPARSVGHAMGRLQSTDVSTTTSATTTFSGGAITFAEVPHAQMQRLDETLNHIMEVLSNNKHAAEAQHVLTSDVMELYEYKVSTMGHAERAAVASAEAASERCVHLQHRVSQLGAEMSRLHGLLHRSQQCHEEATRCRDDLEATVAELKIKLEAERERHKTAATQLKATDKNLKDCQAQLKETRTRLEEVEEQCSKLKQFVNKLEENGTKLEKRLQKKEEMINDFTLKVQELEGQLDNKEFELQTKDVKLEELKKESLAMKQIINQIKNVASLQAD